MKIGVMLAYKPWFSPQEQLDLARRSDRLGLDSVWMAESYGQDVSVMLGLLAGQTERIRLGSAIMQVPARQPTTAAMAASTLDQISGGRFMLGLGLSGPQVSEGWYGVPFGSPLGRTREYVEIIRMALAREPVQYQGKHWSIPLLEGGTGHGKPIRMMGGPVQERLPIYLGVGGPKTIEQAGEIADGWLPFLFNPEDAADQMAHFQKGIDTSGRKRADLQIAPVVPCAIADDVDTARDLVRPIIALYLGGMGAKEKNFYVETAERYGHGAAARACQDKFLAGDIRGAQAALTPEVLDTFAIAATPAGLDKKLRMYEDSGVDELLVTPFGDRPAQLETLADAFGKRS